MFDDYDDDFPEDFDEEPGPYDDKDTSLYQNYVPFEDRLELLNYFEASVIDGSLLDGHEFMSLTSDEYPYEPIRLFVRDVAAISNHYGIDLYADDLEQTITRMVLLKLDDPSAPNSRTHELRSMLEHEVMQIACSFRDEDKDKLTILADDIIAELCSQGTYAQFITYTSIAVITDNMDGTFSLNIKVDFRDINFKF